MAGWMPFALLNLNGHVEGCPDCVAALEAQEVQAAVGGFILLGITDVNYVHVQHALAVVDSTLA